MTDVTVSIPYYRHEFNMRWALYHDVTLTEFLEAAIAQAGEEVLLARFSELLRPPTFVLQIPGRPILSMQSRVHEVLSPGDFVLIQTEEAAAAADSPMAVLGSAGTLPARESNMFPRDRQSETLRAAPGTTLGEMLRGGPSGTHDIASLMTLMMPLPRPSGTTARLNSRYSNLIMGRQPEIPLEERDEEIVVRARRQEQAARMLQVITSFSDVMSRYGPVAERAVVAPPEVKTVLNEETFNRVCPVVPPVNLAEPVPLAEGEEENDIIGGSQDAGLGACSVCLALLVNRSKTPGELRKMPNCSHIFHSQCLAQWLTQNAITCPVCREPAVTDQKDYGYLNFSRDGPGYTPATDVTDDGPQDSDEERPVAEPQWIASFPPARARRID